MKFIIVFYINIPYRRKTVKSDQFFSGDQYFSRPVILPN